MEQILKHNLLIIALAVISLAPSCEDVCNNVPKDSPLCKQLGCKDCVEQIPPVTTTTTTSTTTTTTLPPDPIPTPTPAPTPAPTPSPSNCRKLTQSSLCLEGKPGTFRNEINDALSATTGCAIGSDCFIADWKIAIISVMMRLNLQGFCTSFDVQGGNEGLGSELGVRNSELFTDFYQPITSNSRARWTTPRSVCTPAIDEETLEEVKLIWDIGIPASCFNPTPGLLARWEVKTHNLGPNWRTLDSTPLVGPDSEYCKAIGYTDGRRYCPPRTEGTPDDIVLACLNRVVGPRPKYPMWFWNGNFVPNNATGDVVHDDNPFHLLVRPNLHGTAKVCGDTAICGELTF